MSRVLAVVDDQGHTYACDHRCYDSVNPLRPCVCLKQNRGLGYLAACELTEAHYRDWIIEWQKSHSLIKIRAVEVLGHRYDPDQRTLF